jgi:hypothetical protein
MASKHRNLYLYLALACFLGIILIFIFDGYMGIYDTITMTSGEIPVMVEPDQWQQQARFNFMPSTSVLYGEKVIFSYAIDNHRFSSYEADVSVSVWHNQLKVADLLSDTISAKAFDKGQLDWVFDTTQFVSGNISAGMSRDFTVAIKRGDIERKLIVYVYSDINQMKVIPVAPPPN